MIAIYYQCLNRGVRQTEGMKFIASEAGKYISSKLSLLCVALSGHVATIIANTLN